MQLPLAHQAQISRIPLPLRLRLRLLVGQRLQAGFDLNAAGIQLGRHHHAGFVSQRVVIQNGGHGRRLSALQAQATGIKLALKGNFLADSLGSRAWQGFIIQIWSIGRGCRRRAGLHLGCRAGRSRPSCGRHSTSGLILARGRARGIGSSVPGIGRCIIDLLVLEATIARSACTHGTARQNAHHDGVIQAFAPRLAQCLVLQDLLGHRLRQLFQHALGNRALAHLAQDALLRWLGQRIGGCGRGALCGILGHTLGALGQHHVGIANAQTVGNLVADKAQCTGSQAGTGGQGGLLGGQLAVCGLLADLLCSRARAHHALTSSASDGRALGPHLTQACGSHGAPPDCATGAHGPQ